MSADPTKPTNTSKINRRLGVIIDIWVILPDSAGASFTALIASLQKGCNWSKPKPMQA